MKSIIQLELLSELAHLVRQSEERDKLLCGITGSPEFWSEIFRKAIEKYDGLLIKKSKYVVYLREQLTGSEEAFTNFLDTQKKIARLNRMEEELAILHSMKIIVKNLKIASIGTAIEQYESKEYWRSEHYKLWKENQFVKEMLENSMKNESYYLELALQLSQKITYLKSQLLKSNTHEH